MQISFRKGWQKNKNNDADLRLVIISVIIIVPVIRIPVNTLVIIVSHRKNLHFDTSAPADGLLAV